MPIFPVYIGRCDEYNPEQIADILEKALKSVKPRVPIKGNVAIKPNLVMAHKKIASQAHTRVEVVEGLVLALKKKYQGIEKLNIVEKSGLGVCTSTMYRNAGYNELAKKHHIRLHAMEEGQHVTAVLQQARVHTHITIAKIMSERDALIFVPKLKTNVLSHGYSGALKLNIGTIDGKERLFHHDHNLPAKIVDLLEIANPDLIVTDGIRMAFGGNQMTQRDIAFGAIVVSGNAVAHDMVCARLLNLDPFKIEHIAEAMKRGYGPKSFRDIEILGDYSVARAKKITKGLDYGFQPVDRFKCRFEIKSGVPYCVGGCHGIFLDWLLMIKDKKPHLFDRFPMLTVFIGKVVKTPHRNRVLLIGDCACASEIHGARRVYRIAGCPPSHKRIIWDMMVKLFIFNPLICPSLIIDGYVRYTLKKLKGYLINLRFRQE